MRGPSRTSAPTWGPAIGTREIEKSACAGSLYESVDGQAIPQACFDGNHVVASKHARPDQRQLNIVRGYAAFYNPLNTLRILLRGRSKGMLGKRILFQIIGQIGLVLTAPRLIAWARKIKRGKIQYYTGLIPARIPLVDAHDGHQVFWAIEQTPADYLPQNNSQKPANASLSAKTTRTAGAPKPAPQLVPLRVLGEAC